jgi:tetratricopeptide (TPR) repeat protein
MGFLKKLFTGKDETIEEKNEKNFDILKYDGIKALSSCSCNVDYAISCFIHALEIKEDTETRVYLAKAYTAKEELESVAEQYTLLQRMEPEEPLHPIRLAQVAYQMENYDLMDAACNDALKINTSLAMPHYLLGMKAKAQGDMLKAIIETTQAISIKEDFYDAYMLRAQTLFAMHQFGDAEKDIDFILEHTEPTEDTILLKAETNASLGKIDEAKELFQNIIDYNPFATQAYTGLASALMQQKKTDEALKVIDQAIEQMPENAELYKVRGGIKYLTDDKIGAAEDMKKSLELAPNESDKLTGEYTNFINRC